MNNWHEMEDRRGLSENQQNGHEVLLCTFGETLAWWEDTVGSFEGTNPESPRGHPVPNAYGNKYWGLESFSKPQPGFVSLPHLLQISEHYGERCPVGLNKENPKDYI